MVSKKAPLLAISCVASVLLAGCASEHNYALAVHSWIGASSQQVMQVWGYPNRIMRLDNRHKLYMYRSHQQGQTPVSTIPGSTSIITRGNETTVFNSPPVVTGGRSYNLNCRTWFEVNRHGVVVNSRYRGNNCVGTKQFLQDYRYSK